MSARVFISHSSCDKDQVHALVEDLRAYGVSVWLDDDKIAVGDSISGTIQNGLESSDYVAIWLTRDAVTSGWVEREWQSKYHAEVASGAKMILPLLAEDCDIPHLLKDKRFADFRSDYDEGLNSLLDALGIETERKHPKKKSGSRRVRPTLERFALCLLFIVSILLFILINSQIERYGIQRIIEVVAPPASIVCLLLNTVLLVAHLQNRQRHLKLLYAPMWTITIACLCFWLYTAVASNSIKGFEVTDLLLRNTAGSAELDFRLVNNSDITVTVDRVHFEVTGHRYKGTAAILLSSATYDIDIRKMRKGDTIEFAVSHFLKPGDADRFIVVIRGDINKSWTLRPTLRTSVGDLKLRSVTVSSSLFSL